MERRILGERYVTYSEARKLLEERAKDAELGVPVAVERTLDYLKLFGDRDPEAARRAVEELKGLGLDEVLAVNLANICPREPGEVRSILAMNKELVYDEELVSKILEKLSSYCETVYGEE